MWVIAWNALNSHLSNRELRQCGDRSRRKENRSSLRLVPATLCLFPRCVDVYIYIYILVSLPRADIIFAFLKLKRMQARVTNWFCFDVRNFPYLNWSFVSMNSQSTLECQVSLSIIDLISMKGLDRNSTITFYYPDFSRVRSPLLP